ncbi:MAG TPA: hypothetical protein VKB34_08995 [Povalibacter sp.]|nr:hypothetical protein [Povalibacter sp.]
MLRSFTGLVVIAVLVFISMVLAPDSHPGQARMICNPPVDATYSDISVCTSEPGYRSGACSCIKTFSAWIPIYFFGVLPTTVLLIAFFTFEGSATRRLVCLNGGVILGFVSFFVRTVTRDAMALMGTSVFVALAVACCIGISMLFCAVEFVRKRVGSSVT